MSERPPAEAQVTNLADRRGDRESVAVVSGDPRSSDVVQRIGGAGLGTEVYQED